MKENKNVFDMLVLIIVVFTLCFTSAMASSSIYSSEGSFNFIRGDEITSLKEKYRTSAADDVCDDCDDDDDEGVNIKPDAFIFSVEPNPANEYDDITFEGYGEDEDGEIIEYQWNSQIDGIFLNEASSTSNILSAGNHEINFLVKDNKNAWSNPVSIELEIIENQAPNTPVIAGNINGNVKEEVEFSVITTDPEQHQVLYYVDWDDGSIKEWTDEYASNEEVTITHTWDEKGSYIIKIKAKDIHEEESDWGTLNVQLSKTKTYNPFLQNFIQLLIERYPILEKLF